MIVRSSASMDTQKLARRRPRVVAVERWGPFRSGAMFTLADGRTLFFRSIPTVINSKAVENRARVQKCRAKKKQKNPVTIPKNLFRKLDDAAFKKLEDNRRDPDAKQITFEDAWGLAINDMFAVEAEKLGQK